MSELLCKILASAICRFCLSEELEELCSINEACCENQETPKKLAKKFNIEVNI